MPRGSSSDRSGGRVLATVGPNRSNVPSRFSSRCRFRCSPRSPSGSSSNSARVELSSKTGEGAMTKGIDIGRNEFGKVRKWKVRMSGFPGGRGETSKMIHDRFKASQQRGRSFHSSTAPLGLSSRGSSRPKNM